MYPKQYCNDSNARDIWRSCSLIPHEHLWTFVDACGPFFQEYFSRIHLFEVGFLLLNGISNKWLTELPQNSIVSWEELTYVFLKRFFPLLTMMKLRDSIQNFKRMDGQPILKLNCDLKSYCCNVWHMVSQITSSCNISIVALI